MAEPSRADVEVRRSKRRRRTVSAYREGERIVVLIPAAFSKADEAEWVATMVAASSSPRQAPSSPTTTCSTARWR